MGVDKAAIEYQGKAQALLCHELLSTRCERAFLSLRNDQEIPEEWRRIPQVADSYEGIGPLSGVLSAMEQYPAASWLVLACDLPFVTGPALDELIRFRDLGCPVTAWRDPQKGYPEPLFAIYEPACRAPLEAALEAHRYSLRQVIEGLPGCWLEPADGTILVNVNTQEEYRRAMRDLRSQQAQRPC
jgi:molybdopterin-guanine dinucleotide biosynthesis protein A